MCPLVIYLSWPLQKWGLSPQGSFLEALSAFSSVPSLFLGALDMWQLGSLSWGLGSEEYGGEC